MSLILDALRKLDREKSFLRKRNIDVAEGILRPESPRPRKNPWLISISFTGLAAAILTYGLMSGMGNKGKPEPPMNPPAPERVAASAPPPPAAAPAPASVPVPAGRPPAVARSSSSSTEIRAAEKPAQKPAPPAPGRPKAQVSKTPPPVPKAKPAAPAPPAEPSLPASSGPPPAPPRGTPPARQAPALPEPGKVLTPGPLPAQTPPLSRVIARSAEPAPHTPGADPPSLKISGIVWQEEPSKRRAFINGSALKEGSVIEGVTVVEIQPTKVKFSYQGRTFEISAF